MDTCQVEMVWNRTYQAVDHAPKHDSALYNKRARVRHDMHNAYKIIVISSRNCRRALREKISKIANCDNKIKRLGLFKLDVAIKLTSYLLIIINKNICSDRIYFQSWWWLKIFESLKHESIKPPILLVSGRSPHEDFN